MRPLRAIQHRVKTIPHTLAQAVVEQLCAELQTDFVPRSQVLSWNELRKLAQDGITLAAHTRTHPALTQLDSDAVATEVQTSFEDLKRQIGTVPPVFCYPFGLHDDEAVEEVKKQGVELAFTCLDGHNGLPSADPLRLRRTVITRRTSRLIFGLRLWKTVSYVDMWRHRSRSETTPVEERNQQVATWAPRAAPGANVAYVMSRFPKLSETFVLNEIVALESLGVHVEVYPLLRERQPITHPEAHRWVERAHFHPFFSLPILQAQALFIRQRPRSYFRVLLEVLGGTWGNANFFVGALGIFPKSVRFAYEMQAQGITHVHAHFATHPAVAALIIHRLTEIPFSFVAHGSDLHVERRMLSAKVEAAKFAVTVSDFNKEVMIGECGEHSRRKIHVIHCGVDPAFFAPPLSRVPEDPLQIVCVASLLEVKGHRFLVDACRMLWQRGVAFRCHLVGDGPLRSDLEDRITQAKLQDCMLLLGGKPRAEVAKLLSAADVAVLASHPTPDGKREGIPVALMEAMAAELPVVASDLTGIPELVEHEVTGLLVPPGNARALADALECLGSNLDLRRRMGRAGRKKVIAEFDLTANTRELLALFCENEPKEPGDVPSPRAGTLAAFVS